VNPEQTKAILAKLAEVRELCPDMRFGQMLAFLDELARDEPGRSLWDVEDKELLEVIQRFRQDLELHTQNVAS